MTDALLSTDERLQSTCWKFDSWLKSYPLNRNTVLGKGVVILPRYVVVLRIVAFVQITLRTLRSTTSNATTIYCSLSKSMTLHASSKRGLTPIRLLSLISCGAGGTEA